MHNILVSIQDITKNSHRYYANQGLKLYEFQGISFDRSRPITNAAMISTKGL